MGAVIKVSKNTYQDIVKQVGQDAIDKYTVSPEVVDTPGSEQCNKISGTEDMEKNTQDIIRLHNEIVQSLARSLSDAFRIGELLFEQKGLMEHGKFTSWVKVKLPFSVRTAQRYMKLFQYKQALENKGIDSITEAYQHIFSEPVGNEIIEVDESLTIPSGYVVHEENLDTIEVPKKQAKGQMEKIDNFSGFLIDTVVSGKYWKGQEGKFVKIVIRFTDGNIHNKRIGEFVAAAGKYLKSGGKIIFYKE